MNKAVVIFIFVFLAFSQQNKEINKDSIPQASIAIGEQVTSSFSILNNYERVFITRVDQIKNKFVFIKMSVDKIYQHLQFTIRVTKNDSSLLVQCKKDDVDSCFIQSKKLVKDDILFILLICEDKKQIQFAIHTYWSDIQHITVDKKSKFYFSQKNPTQIYHLQIPSNVQFKELQIIVKPQTRRSPFDKIKFFGKYGINEIPTETNYDFTSISLWQDSQGIFLTKNDLKGKGVNLLLVGEIHTVYTMDTILLNKTHNDVKLNYPLYQYLQSQQSYVYHLIFYDEATKKQLSEQFSFKLSVFSGQIDVNFYQDKQKNKQITMIDKYKYVQDTQIIFSQQQIQQYKDGIYVQLKSRIRVSSFMIQFNGRSKKDPIILKQNIYQFIPMFSQQNKIVYLTVSRYIQNQQNDGTQNFVLSLNKLKIFQDFQLIFKQCNATKSSCITDDFNQLKSLDYVVKTLGEKSIYKLNIPESAWLKYNIAQQIATIAIRVSVGKTQRMGLVGLQYNIGNRVQYLRDTKPIEGHVNAGQYKIYKHIIEDKNVTKLKIYVNPISGEIQSFYSKKVMQDNSKYNISSQLFTNNAYELDVVHGEPIIIVVQGITSAIFSVILQPFLNKQHTRSSIVLSQDVQFKFKLGSDQSEVIEIIPINGGIYLDYKSTGPIFICKLTNMICQNLKHNYSSIGKLQIQKFNQREAFFQIQNLSPTHNVQVTVLFHSKKDEAHCQLTKSGTIHSLVAQDGFCLRTNVEKNQPFQMIITREQLGNIYYVIFLCDKIIKVDNNKREIQRILINQVDIVTMCKNQSQKIVSLYVKSTKKQQKSNEKIHIKYLMQFLSGVLVLPDGVGYHGSDIGTQSYIRRFSYPLLNIKDTTITVSSSSNLAFIAKVVEKNQRDSIIPSQNDNDAFYSPQNKYIFTKSLYKTIKKEQLQKFTCKQCQLIIFLYSKQNGGQLVQYTIQVIQNFVYLQQNQPKTQALLQNSYAYYGYKSKGLGKLLIQLSDNNLNCAQLFYHTQQYPDKQHFQKNSNDGQIISQIVNPNVTIHYISVYAKVYCAFTIVASLINSNLSVTKLIRGSPGFLNLAQNQVKYFTFKHYSDKPIKILSLHTFGSVTFYLNKTSNQDLSTIMKSTQIQFRDFPIQGDRTNRLYVSNNNSHFCKDCMYLLAVQAHKKTKSSIFLGDNDAKVMLSETKVLNDMLVKKGDIMKGSFYYIAKGKIQVRIHSGSLQVEIGYKDQIIKSKFQKNDQSHFYNFTFKTPSTYFDDAFIKCKALQDNTVYSLRVSKQSDYSTGNSTQPVITKQKLNPLQSTYLYLSQLEKKCVIGYLKMPNQKLFVSFYNINRQNAKQINVTAKISNQRTNISTSIARNVMQISFIDAEKKKLYNGQEFQVCFANTMNNSFSIIVFQTEDTNLLPNNVQTLVANSRTFDIFPQGKFIFDIFECKGAASIKMGKNKKQIDQAKQNTVQMIGMSQQAHAVKIQQLYSNTLINIVAEKALIRWIPYDSKKQIGTGYVSFSAGRLTYDQKFGIIQFNVSPLKKSKKKSKSTIKNVRYSLYISNQDNDLKQASMCETYMPNSVLQYRQYRDNLAQSIISFTIDKYVMKEKYTKSQNLFANVVADLTLQNPEKQEEYYRFVYEPQQIPKELFTPSQLENFHLSVLVAIAGLSIITLIVFAWICTKMIVPMIGRLRNRVLVEENNQDRSLQKKPEPQIENQYIQPPKSSQRNQINTATQQKM